MLTPGEIVTIEEKRFQRIFSDVAGVKLSASTLRIFSEEEFLYITPEDVPAQLRYEKKLHERRAAFSRQRLGGYGFTRQEVNALIDLPVEQLVPALHGLLD